MQAVANDVPAPLHSLYLVHHHLDGDVAMILHPCKSNSKSNSKSKIELMVFCGGRGGTETFIYR